MERQLDFYQINADYINYLLKFDSRVPKIDYSEANAHEKFLCGIVLNVHGHDYFAPISSFKTPQRTNIIIKDVNGKDISSIRFSFMIPVPPGVASIKRIADETSVKYRVLLNMELQFCRKNASKVYSKAKFVYESVTKKRDPLMIKNCCNFTVLENACIEYAKSIGLSSKPTKISP